MATCAECGIKVVSYVLAVVRNKEIALPGEIPLQLISKETGFTPQLIGSSFDGYIKNALAKNFLIARKAGNPGRLQLSKSAKHD